MAQKLGRKFIAIDKEAKNIDLIQKRVGAVSVQVAESVPLLYSCLAMRPGQKVLQMTPQEKRWLEKWSAERRKQNEIEDHECLQFFATPPQATKLLLSRVRFEGLILEPCALCEFFAALGRRIRAVIRSVDSFSTSSRLLQWSPGTLPLAGLARRLGTLCGPRVVSRGPSRPRFLDSAAQLQGRL